MEIIGNGFIARNFACMEAAYEDVVLFAGGVSRSGGSDDAAFYREVEVLYEAIQRCQALGRLLVYFSTSSNMMYCSPASQGLEDGPVFPRQAYARHKLAMETVIRLSGIDYLILRLASPVGRYQKGFQLLPALYEQVQGGVVMIHEGARRYLIDVEDVVSLTGMLLMRGVRCEVLNMASLYPTSIEDIVDYLASKVASPIVKRFVHNPHGYADMYRVSLAKLERCVGGLEGFHFDREYYKRVIDKYF